MNTLKKNFKHESACFGTDCPFRVKCRQFYLLNEKSDCKAVYRNQFIKRDSGKVECSKFQGIGL